MHPDTLASLLAANPYPGCVVTRPLGDVRLDFDGLTIVYRADGWYFDDLLLESKLDHFDPVRPGDVFTEIRRILKVCFEFKVQRALNKAETFGTPDPVEYLTDLAAEKMLSILDVAALASARQAKIASNVAEAAARDMRIADLERDLAAKDASLKTANAGLKRICEVIGAPVPCVAEDAVEAVKRQLGDDNDANAHAERAEAALAEIGRALEDAGAPQVYHLEDDTERGIPDPERIRLLGERIHTLRAQVREAADATNYLDALIEAHNALDALKAPRLADGCVLSLAARIRAIPR